MYDEDLIKKSYEVLERDRKLPARQRLQRLIDKGVIDEKGHVQLWDAFLAVVAIKRNSGGKRIEYFRCLKPAFGMPGAAQIDISRDSMAKYVGEENKRVITAYLDEKQNRWKEGDEVHVTSRGYLRTDPNDIEEDNLCNVPEFRTVNSGL